MDREQLKAVIVEVLATTHAADLHPSRTEWKTHAWHRHLTGDEPGDGHRGYLALCALCRSDIPALADALTEAIDKATTVPNPHLDINRADWKAKLAQYGIGEDGHESRRVIERPKD